MNSSDNLCVHKNTIKFVAMEKSIAKLCSDEQCNRQTSSKPHDLSTIHPNELINKNIRYKSPCWENSFR